MSRFPKGYEAYPIAKPLSKKDMEFNSRRWTLCQIIRELYREIDDPEIKLELRIAGRMAKTMANAIRKYEPYWGKSKWPYRT